MSEEKRFGASLEGENQQQTQPKKDIAPGFEQHRPHWWDLNALQTTQSLLKRNLIVKNEFYLLENKTIIFISMASH